MKIYGILNFTNWKVLKICYFSKLNDYKNLTIFKIVKLGNFLDFSKLELFGIFRIASFLNFSSWKCNKFLEFFQFEKPNLAKKNGNFEIVCPFNISHYSQFCQFSYLTFGINQFSQFLFPILVTRKFGRSTFESSLIFKFESHLF